MRSFSLEEFKKDASRRVVTRDGREVRILCTDRISEFPIIALVFDIAQQEEVVVTFQKDGKYDDQRGENPLDLFFALTKREGWVNLFKDEELPFINGDVYKSEKDAKEAAIGEPDFIASVKIEWEE